MVNSPSPSYLDMVKSRIRGIDGTFNRIHDILIAGDVRSIPVVNPVALHRERVRLVNIMKQLENEQ
jgi:hypothetical protein